MQTLPVLAGLSGGGRGEDLVQDILKRVPELLVKTFLHGAFWRKRLLSFFFLHHLTLVSWSSRWCLPFFLKTFLHKVFVNSSHSLSELRADLLPLAKTLLSRKFQGHFLSRHPHVYARSGKAHNLFQQGMWLTLPESQRLGPGNLYF